MLVKNITNNNNTRQNKLGSFHQFSQNSIQEIKTLVSFFSGHNIEKIATIFLLNQQ